MSDSLKKRWVWLFHVDSVVTPSEKRRHKSDRFIQIPPHALLHTQMLDGIDSIYSHGICFAVRLHFKSEKRARSCQRVCRW